MLTGPCHAKPCEQPTWSRERTTLNSSAAAGSRLRPARRFARLAFPMEVRAEVSALGAASLAGEPLLDIGQPDIIRPLIGADRCPLTTVIVGAIDQHPARAPPRTKAMHSVHSQS